MNAEAIVVNREYRVKVGHREGEAIVRAKVTEKIGKPSNHYGPGTPQTRYMILVIDPLGSYIERGSRHKVIARDIKEPWTTNGDVPSRGRQQQIMLNIALTVDPKDLPSVISLLGECGEVQITNTVIV